MEMTLRDSYSEPVGISDQKDQWFMLRNIQPWGRVWFKSRIDPLLRQGDARRVAQFPKISCLV